MRKIPKEMKVVIIWMMVECIFLYCIYNMNSIYKDEGSKDSNISYSNVSADYNYKEFTDDEKKNINYDYEIPYDYSVCKFIDNEVVLVVDRNNIIKEYDYKTKKSKRVWGRIEEGYIIQNIEISKNKLFYLARKEKANSKNNNKEYDYKIVYIDSDKNKEGRLYKYSGSERNLGMKLYKDKLVMVRDVYNCYEVGYIDTNTLEYKLIYRDNNEEEKYEINNFDVFEGKIYWSKQIVKGSKGKIYICTYDLNKESLDLDEFEVDNEDNIYVMPKIIFYNGDFFTIRDYMYRYTEDYNNFLQKYDLESKYYDLMNSLEKKILGETIDDRELDVPTINNSVIKDNKLIMYMSYAKIPRTVIYDFKTKEFNVLSDELFNNFIYNTNVIDISNDIYLCTVYQESDNKKLNLVKKIN